MPYKDKDKQRKAKAEWARRNYHKQHTEAYYLRKARDAALKEGNLEDAQSLEDRWGVTVSSRPKEVKTE